MRPSCNLVVLFLGIMLSACAVAAPPPGCPPGLSPLSTVPPKLPSRLHNEFSGKAEVSFVISSAGHVQSPTIVSTTWQPIGRSTGKPFGYNEAILSAVAQWRYPHRQQACRHQVPVKLEFQDSSSHAAGRSNISFEADGSAAAQLQR
jgi:hypothetical protein